MAYYVGTGQIHVIYGLLETWNWSLDPRSAGVLPRFCSWPVWPGQDMMKVASTED